VAHSETEHSLEVLADLFEPDHIYGFDPHPDLDEDVTEVCGVPVTLRRQAAWIFDGVISFTVNGNASHTNGSGFHIPCFDFSAWLAKLQAGYIIVKMDIEGAEVPILQAMSRDGTIERVDELLVEWHGQALPDLVVREWWM
jgi:FkbM family methyltransferase